ncbi:hypothetical protein H7J86_28875 [Mycobacterium hackensackense]|uniref:hypothetical protein n=1 Tax=Mycobacterium hackensackense TaxID=228909 RepID=UPI002265F22F|nr:hypothetical protein [Mycobacterium hackensackense]MCV7256193.1 hypothetical protein [Mycobacterium hackensackense]
MTGPESGCAMCAAISPNLRRPAAAAAALSVAFAVMGLPIAVAHADDLTCSNGEVAMDGTCVPPTDNSSAALGLPQGNVGDVVSSLNNPSLFDPPYQLTEAEVASPGYNAGAGHAGGGGGGGHGR